MNCSSCNFTNQPDAKYCANCGQSLWLISEVSVPSQRNKVNKLLIFLCVFMCFESFFYLGINVIEHFFHVGFYRYGKYFFILLSLAFTALPLIISLFMPKASGARKVFLVLGIVTLCLKFVWTIYSEFISSDYNF
jgi:hypothetical protein